MQIEMQNAEALTGQQIAEFLRGSEGIAFAGGDRAAIYQWMEQLLVAQEYARKGKKERGAIRRDASKVTGLRLPQITRLIRSYRATGTIALRPSRRRRFPGKYTDRDVRLLAEVDTAHERLSGPATKCILKREHKEYGKAGFARLSEISVSHIYNLRASTKYRRVAANFEPTRPSPVSIGERRRPEPLGRPGFLRIDTVHQGDWDGEKGVYHINAVDAVTQWEIVGCTARIKCGESETSAGSDAAASVSIPDPGRSLRQRLGVHQLLKGRDDEGHDGGVHQEPRLPKPGQRAGGREERSHHSKAHWIRPHTGGTCREAARILCRASEPVSQLPSALRVCDGKPGCQRQTRTKVQDRRLRDAAPETRDAARRENETQAWDQPRSTGSESRRNERHRIRPAAGCGKDQDAGTAARRFAEIGSADDFLQSEEG